MFPAPSRSRLVKDATPSTGSCFRSSARTDKRGTLLATAGPVPETLDSPFINPQRLDPSRWRGNCVLRNRFDLG